MNYPIDLESLHSLDTLKQQPKIVRFMTSSESGFRSFGNDIRIQGRRDARPTWRVADSGCFEVVNGANVHIMDFNFNGHENTPTLITVESGTLVLENCDLEKGGSWAIKLGKQGELILRNVRFLDLKSGGIQMSGGNLHIDNVSFLQAGAYAVEALGGELFKAVGLLIQNSSATGLSLSNIEEIWLDSVRIESSFEDGLAITNSDLVYIADLTAENNGRYGAYLEGDQEVGFLHCSFNRNQVAGLALSEIDSVRMLNSEMVGNKSFGGVMHQVDWMQLRGIQVGHNGVNGMMVTQGFELSIDHSTFQGNPNRGLELGHVDSISLTQISLLNNGSGMMASDFKSLRLGENLMLSNKQFGLEIERGEFLELHKNLIKSNHTGLLGNHIQQVHMDSNRVIGNKAG